MDDHWKNRVDGKLDKLVEHNSTQDSHLVELKGIAKVNSEILEEHQLASKNNGIRIRIVEDELLTHLTYVKTWLKVVKWIIGVPASILSIISVVLSIFYTIQKFS